MATWMPRGDPWSSSLSSVNVSDRRRLMLAASSGRSMVAPRRGTFQRKPGRAEVRQRARRRKLAAAPDPSRARSLEPVDTSPREQSPPLAAQHGAAETVEEDISQDDSPTDAPVATAASLLVGLPRSETLWAHGADEVAEDRTLEAALAELRLERKRAVRPLGASDATRLHDSRAVDVAGADHCDARSHAVGPHQDSQHLEQSDPVRTQRVRTQREFKAELHGWDTATPDTPPKTRTPDGIAAAVVGPPPPEAERSPPLATLAHAASVEKPQQQRATQQQRRRGTRAGNTKSNLQSGAAAGSSVVFSRQEKQTSKAKPLAKQRLGPKTPNDADCASFLNAPEWEVLSAVRDPGTDPASDADSAVDSRPTTSVLKAAEAAALKALGATCRARQFEAVMAVEEEQKDEQPPAGRTSGDSGDDSGGSISDAIESEEEVEYEDDRADELSRRLAELPDDDAGPLFGQATLKTWGRSKVRERVKARGAQPRAQSLSRKTASVAAKYQKQSKVTPKLQPGRISEGGEEDEDSMSCSPTSNSPSSLPQYQQHLEDGTRHVLSQQKNRHSSLEQGMDGKWSASGTGSPIGPSAEAAAKATPYRVPTGSRPYRRRRQPVGGGEGEKRTAVRRIESTVVQ